MKHNCINHSLCNNRIPDWMTICIDCDMLFGTWINGKVKLKEYQNFECPICLEIKTVFEQPKCDHKICADCFRVIYFGNVKDLENIIGEEPKYPYQYILDQNLELDYDYFDDITQFPLTQK